MKLLEKLSKKMTLAVVSWCLNPTERLTASGEKVKPNLRFSRCVKNKNKQKGSSGQKGPKARAP